MKSKTKPVYVDTELYHTLDKLPVLNKITIAEVIRQLVEQAPMGLPSHNGGILSLAIL